MVSTDIDTSNFLLSTPLLLGVLVDVINSGLVCLNLQKGRVVIYQIKPFTF
ncbi:MAG: hypothetical protein CM15mP22_8380 [Gammaproteobacteria bacterium]|nr:MAG: hypothetical protein CM15mP22_8380 [Gammaproteobacteria bacterium]